mmetsp:Transcript_71020/g.205907  ORF Transcript_71020/g.205907 Transcript_71020/m.205907 type:complete len:344 (+) Transcript_71020:42-1073(+)
MRPAPASAGMGRLLGLDAATVVDVSKKLVLCMSYIVTSAGLIRFNKYLMHTARFPHAMVLTFFHMTFSFVLCSCLYLLRPRLFPGIASSAGKRILLLKWFIPIGLFYAVSLFASNQAYLYCNVTFLQFLKESNVAIAFTISCLLGLQVINRTKCAIIVWVIVGSSLTVSGEMHFVWLGFGFQIVSQLCECTRAVMGEVVLSGGGLKLDPMSYTLFCAPTCMLVLLVGNMFDWDHSTVEDFKRLWPVLLPNVLLAFVLNVLVACMLKEISAVGFILTGIIKDICIVLFSAVAFHEPVMPVQVLGFVITIMGVFTWSAMKIAPTGQLARSLDRLFGVREADPKGS